MLARRRRCKYVAIHMPSAISNQEYTMTRLQEPTVPTTAPTQSHAPLDRRIVLSGLWISMLFVFAYVDIFAFFRADMIEGALAGELPRVGFDLDQTFLALTTLYILPASLMVVGSLTLPYRFNRIANVTLAPIYALTIIAGMIGEPWVYYLMGSSVEIVMLVVIARVAHRWR